MSNKDIRIREHVLSSNEQTAFSVLSQMNRYKDVRSEGAFRNYIKKLRNGESLAFMEIPLNWMTPSEQDFTTACHSIPSVTLLMLSLARRRSIERIDTVTRRTVKASQLRADIVYVSKRGNKTHYHVEELNGAQHYKRSNPSSMAQQLAVDAVKESLCGALGFGYSVINCSESSLDPEIYKKHAIKYLNFQ